MVERDSVRRAVVVAVIATGLVFGALAAPAAAARVWSIGPSANQGTNTNFLYGVSCVSSSSCTAVGFSTSPNVDLTLIESWNGTGWTIVPSPSPGAVWNFLYGVSCVSSSSCTAVGRFENSNGINRTLVLSWNGSVWSRVLSANRGLGNNVLTAVSCISASACVAVGRSQAGPPNHTLVESWNGSAWSIVPSPNVTFTTDNSLESVSCMSADVCTAVGSFRNGSGFQHTLVESWDGSVWSVAPSPNRGTAGNVLTGVSCAADGSCKAVGNYGAGAFDKGGFRRTLVESWDGTEWSVASSPNRGTEPNVLAGVSCVSAGSCKAVGWYQQTSGGPYHTLIEPWDGTNWRLVSSPNRVAGSTPDNYLGVTGSALTGVSCLSAISCRAVGFHVNAGGFDQTLVESYQ